ncbi:MAG: Fn3-like domain-containing protein [Candidatus Moranbacteria bacterium]|nr:Fn3-like domain-containing protein [Candidatus Moranbacteria bacterium]
MGRISTKLLSLFIVLGLFVPVVSRAQSNGLSLLTSPLPILMKTTPGVPVTTDIKLRNTGTGEETLKVSLMKFEAYEESGKPALMEAEPTDEFLKWVKFSEDVFTVAPGEWKTIQATITPPKEASFGYYYAFVFSRANENLSPEERRTALNGGTAILALLDVDVPGAKKEITLEKFSLDKSVYEFLPTTFTVTLKNQGNVHAAPRGNIYIDKGDEKDIALIEVNKEKGNILPSSKRAFEAVWVDGFPKYTPKIVDDKEVKDAEGNTVMELQWDFKDASKLRFGHYTAKLLMIYDDGTHDVPLEGEVSFWVIPWRIIGGGLILLLFVGLGLRSILGGVLGKMKGKK